MSGLPKMPWAYPDLGQDYDAYPIDTTHDHDAHDHDVLHCQAEYSSEYDFICTRAAGHYGPHAAGDVFHIVAQWES